MDRFLLDLRFAMRTLVTRRAFSLIAIITLALGIGITTAIFSVVNGILLRPLPFRDSDRVVTVWETSKKEPRPHGEMSHPGYLDIQKQATSFESLAEYSQGTVTLTGDGPATVVVQGNATPGFFHVLGATPIMGREFSVNEDLPNGPKVVVVGYDFWKTRLGGRNDVVGTTIGIAAAQYRIVGVAPQNFDFPGKAQLWMPPQNDDAHCGRGCVYLSMIGRLRPGATVKSAQEELTTLARRYEQLYPKSNANHTIRINTLQRDITGDVRPALIILLAAVAMVLLIACANVANLLLVRGAGRRAELAVRSVLGAERGRILAQLMTENLVLAACAGVAGIGLAMWMVDALRRIAPASIPRASEVGLDTTTTLFAIGLVFATALLFGLAPALQLSRQSLSSSVRNGGRGSDGSPRRLTRSAILVAEVALSVMLLLGAGLLMRSFVQLNKVNIGFDPTNVSTFTLSLSDTRYPTPDSHVAAFEAIKSNVKQIPGVVSVASVLGLPLGDINFTTSFERQDLAPSKPGDEPIAKFTVIDEDYLKTLHIPVLRGRTFTSADRHDGAQVALISRATADKYFKGADPIGKQIHVGVGLGYPNNDVQRTIVGIVEDVRADNLQDMPRPNVYVPAAQTGADFQTFVVRSLASSDQVFANVRNAVRLVDADVALEYTSSLDQLVENQLAAPRFYLALIGMFAALAALLAAVGIYGVVSYLVANRTREIGIRMALGAQWQRVVRLVVWQGLRPALAGVALGLAGAYASVKVLGSLLYGVAPHDFPTYAAVTAVLITLVLIACALPAYRATRIPPGVALRSE